MGEDLPEGPAELALGQGHLAVPPTANLGGGQSGRVDIRAGPEG